MSEAVRLRALAMLMIEQCYTRGFYTTRAHRLRQQNDTRASKVRLPARCHQVRHWLLYAGFGGVDCPARIRQCGRVVTETDNA